MHFLTLFQEHFMNSGLRDKYKDPRQISELSVNQYFKIIFLQTLILISLAFSLNTFSKQFSLPVIDKREEMESYCKSQ